MPHVLYTAFDLVPSPKGAGTHIMHFLRGLVKAGYDVQLMTPGDGQLSAIDTYEGAKVIRVPPPPDRNFLAHAIHFGEAVIDHVAGAPRYDVVHYRSIWSGLALAQNKARFGYKTLFEVNGLPSIELKYHYPALRGSDLLLKVREQELATLALSDAIICPSGGDARLSDQPRHAARSDHGDSQRCQSARFCGHPPARSIQRRPDDPLSRHARRLAGTRSAARGHDHDSPHSNRPTCASSDEGATGSANSYRSAFASWDWKGPSRSMRPCRITKCRSVIAAADVCVAPLALNDRNVTQGCCPIKVIEYMSCARPIVAANLPVVRELVREDIDALLFAPDDADDLARQILRVLNDRALAEKLATNAAERARSKLTWHDAQKKLLKVYEQSGKGCVGICERSMARMN